MENNPAFLFFSSKPDLGNAPINPDWIIEGSPKARSSLLTSGSDKSGSIVVWDCTAGKFNWHYSFDETCFIQEGNVTLRNGDAAPARTAGPGDIVFFPKGSHALWHVENYVRKLAFCHLSFSGPLQKPVALLRRLDRQIHGGSAGAEFGFG